MKKVFLVDDEILVRESIRDCIDWEKEGFIYCGDASDGEVALPLIEQMLPDILITDIKMPFMNGLELSAIVRKRMPDVKIVILSGHDEFEYARSALRVGVEEYCLKPVSAADIIALLHEQSRRIDLERLERDQKAALLQVSQSNAEQRKQKLLNDLCCGFITTAEAIHSAAALSINVTSPNYAVVITDIRCVEGSSRLDPELILQAEMQLHQHLDGAMDYFSYKRSQSETIWIIKGNSAANIQLVLEPFPELMKAAVEGAFPCVLSIGLGTIQERLQGIHVSYLDAEDDKHWRKMSAQNRLGFWHAAGSVFNPSLLPDRNRFIEFLKLGSIQQLPAFLATFTESLRAVDWRGSFYGYYLLNDLTIEVFQLAKSMYRNASTTTDYVVQFQQDIENVRSLEEASTYLKKLLEQFWKWRFEAADKYADMLGQVKDYIIKHYSDDTLSLHDIAEHVRVSPSHLSKVFSQESGQTFIEFLTLIRIRKAQELLQSSSAKSYEIAHLVGYNDAHYFSNLFKRVTGMTTMQFRKQQQAGTSPIATQGAEYGNSNLFKE